MEYVQVKLDKVRNLRLAYKAQKIIENMTGKGMDEVVSRIPTTSEQGIMLYAGLVHEDKELTLDIVEDLIDQHLSAKELADVLGKAIEVAYRKESTEEKNV